MNTPFQIMETRCGYKEVLCQVFIMRVKVKRHPESTAMPDAVIRCYWLMTILGRTTPARIWVWPFM